MVEILKILAQFPIQLKGNFITKIATRISNLVREEKKKSGEHMASTNLGINKKLKVNLPLFKVPPFLLYGTPECYDGEYNTISLCKELIQSSTVFIDIGANWGYFTYFISNHSSKNIYWFEPNPELYLSIFSNTKDNFGNIYGSDKAVSNIDGELIFYVNKKSDLESSIVAPNDDSYEIVKVQSLRFDTWCLTNKIPDNILVKVDVENAEWQFIEGAKGAISKIRFLIMEVLGPARQSGFINHMIHVHGFNAYYINKNNIELVPKEDNRYTEQEYNWLFCKLDATTLKNLLAKSNFSVIE